MERYFTFPGTGTGIHHLAKDVDLSCIWVMGSPDTVPVMRKERLGDWVKFDDALQRSHQEFDKGKALGLKQAGEPTVIACDECYDSGQIQGHKDAEERHKSEILTAYQDGLKVGKAQGQAKLDAYKQASDFVGYAGAGADATDPTFEVAPSHLNRLLNELYHDRARLEKTVQEFVDVAIETSDDVGELAEVLKTFPNANEALKDHVHNLQICATALGVYVDLFGDKG